MANSSNQTGQRRRQTMIMDLADFKQLVDKVDTKFGHDPLVADLVRELDDMADKLERNGRVFRRTRKVVKNATGYRNVTFHKKSGKYVGRIRYTDGNGKRQELRTGYISDPKLCSDAIEEHRMKLGLT